MNDHHNQSPAVLLPGRGGTEPVPPRAVGASDGAGSTTSTRPSDAGLVPVGRADQHAHEEHRR